MILSLELRYDFGKVLDTQNYPIFRLAFICITRIILTMIFISQTLNMHAVISKQITIKSGKIIWNIAHERISKNNEHMRGTNMRNKYLHEMVIATTLKPISLIPLWSLKAF